MDVKFIPKGGAFVLRKSDRSRTLFGGVLILGAANLLVKLIGLFFKIPLSRLLGDEGMGYFNTGYTVYSWLFLIGCTGFPSAVSMLVSETTEIEGGSGRGARRILFVSLSFLFCLGAAGSLLLFFFRDRIAAKIGNPGSAEAIGAIAPAVLFCALSGGIRGYFQGKKRMAPTAFSQLTEAALKLLFGVGFARAAISGGKSITVVAAAAIKGVAVGCAASTVFLFLGLLIEPKDRNINKGKERGSFASLSGRILSIACPVTFSATVMSLTGLIDLVFVMRRLTSSGYALSEATAIFGNYTTLSVPFFNLPGVLIAPIATGIVPFISGDIARGDTAEADRRCRGAIRFAVVITLPAAAALGLFGEKILSLFFLEDSARLAAPSLAVLSPGIVFLGIATVTSAILQARGKAGVTVFSMVLGAAVKMVAGYYLMGIPSFGVRGAALGTVLCYAVASLVNLFALSFCFTAPFSIRDVFGPILSLALSFAFGFLVYSIIGANASRFGTVLFLFVSAALYLPLSFLFGSITPSDIKTIPILRRIYSCNSSSERVL